MYRQERLLDSHADVSDSTFSSGQTSRGFTSTSTKFPFRTVAIASVVVVLLLLIVIIPVAVSFSKGGSDAGNGQDRAVTSSTASDVPVSALSSSSSAANVAPLWPAAGGLPPCGKEDCGVDCKGYPKPLFNQLPTIPKLPSPFLSIDGTNITKQSQWQCRRAEISQQFQAWELGIKPPRPNSVIGVVNQGCCLNGTITVSVGDNPFITFTATYTLPSTGSAPYPAIIGIGGISLTQAPIKALGVAIIVFPNNVLAQQNGPQSRGQGQFYNLYGANHTASALMAWAWGVSRLIDVLEMDTGKVFDTTRLGVSGCSRNGKGALVVGAFDERIALTIPQESGSGGSASWRLSDWQGTQVQTLGEITGENVWFTQQFNLFNAAATKLPVDHHELEGMVAPRGLLIIENSAMVWLGNITCWGDSLAGNLIYQSLGIGDSQGVSQVSHGDHCGQPASQQPEISAFITKFLLGQKANTSILYTDMKYPTFSLSEWAPWTVPILT